MTMKRWWTELWNPSLKCERLSEHAITTKSVHGYRLPTRNERGVAVGLSGRIKVCKRCGFLEDAEHFNERKIDSLELDSDTWTRLKRMKVVYFYD